MIPSLIFPTPTLSPSDTAQVQQMLSQIHNHQFTGNQAYLALLSLSNPLPWSMKLSLYHFLNAIPLPHIPTALLVCLFIVGPTAVILLLFLFGALLFYLTKHFFPIVSSLFKTQEQEKTFLSITFPHDTSKSSYATEQLYKVLHSVTSFRNGVLSSKKLFSLEIVATRNEGIRYIIGTPQTDVDVIKRNLLSYLPGLMIEEIPDYLTTVDSFHKSLTTASIDEQEQQLQPFGVLEFTLSHDFVLPLADQKKLGVHDSISPLLGTMTKLQQGELVAFQIVLSPTLSSKAQFHIQKIKNTIYQGQPVAPRINKKSFLSGILPSPLLFILSPLLWAIVALGRLVLHLPYLVFDPNGSEAKSFFGEKNIPLEVMRNPYEQEVAAVVKEKMSQHLFETAIRTLVVTNDDASYDTRQAGIIASFSQFTNAYQSLTTKNITGIPFLGKRALKKRLVHFSRRDLSSGSTIVSSSELTDLYHFPNMDITKIEGLRKSKSNPLPSPLSMKRDEKDLDVIVGMNTYGGEETAVGLFLKERRQHTYIVGKTGMGKSTIIAGMALQDIQRGKGVCVIDPHGDMVEHILKLIPQERKQDVVYVNPADKDFPIGLNILRPGVSYKDQEEEQRNIALVVMEVFMKITPERHWGQRMEHILRNAVLTALQIKPGTVDTPYVSLYTIQKLLTDDKYRKIITKELSDPIIKQFWEKEFALFLKGQQGDMIAPLTNKIGEFITDPLSRRILL